jgi:WD40 repeat protein
MLRLWNLGTRRELTTLRGHTATVGALAFSGDGHWLASGGWDGEIRLWPAPSFAEIAAAESKKEKGLHP